MKSVIVLVALFCLIVSATAIGAWPKPWEVSNEETMMETNYHHNKFSFKDSKIWKCVSNNGSGAAISISYPGPPQPSNKSPPPLPAPKKSPPSPPTPKKSPPPPKPSLPPAQSPKSSPPPPLPTPKSSPPPPTPSTPSPPPPRSSPPPPTASPPPPTPEFSPPPPTPSPPPPRPSPPPPTASPPPPPTPKKSHPPLKLSPPPPATPKKSTPAPPTESTPSPAPPTEPTRPEPSTYYKDPWGHFVSCISNFASSAICKQQMEVSYYTGRFRVSEYCCNLIVNMRHECTDVIAVYFNDPFFVPLLHCTCHVKY